MITRYIKGDVLNAVTKKSSTYTALVHGCNCFCTMGKGIAPQIKSLFPEAFKADKLTKRGDIQKLGSCSMAYVEEFDLHVVNAYTQYSFAKSYVSGEVHVDYEAIKNAFSFLNFRFKGGILAIPKIGAGLAGGDWEEYIVGWKYLG